MYKVIIVDDDRIIRRGLKSVIPWEENGFTLVGEAGDGEEGLALIEKEQPHIVLSDIKMPFMDGLEMAKNVREKKIKSKIILLTGYEDFQYAHEALKIKAFDYLLKPVETEHLLEKMKEAKTEWEHDSKKAELFDNMISVQQQQFLKNWLSNKVTKEEIFRKLQDLISDGPSMNYSAMYIYIDEKYELEELTMQITENVIELIKLCLGDYSIQYVLLHAEKDVICLLSATKLPNLEADRYIKDISEQLVEFIRNNGQTTVTITRGRAKQGLLELRESVLEASEVLKHRYRLGKNKTYSIDDLRFSAFEQKLDFQSFIDKLIQYIKLGMKEKVMGHLIKTGEHILHDSQCSFQEIYMMVMQACNVLFHDSTHWMKDVKRDDLLEIQQKMMNMQTIEELFECLKIISLDMAESMHQQHLNQKLTVVDKAINFIQEHFYLEELSLQRVADEVHVSPAYLSSLFKAEKGFNFGDYLMECRMKYAMQLFRETDLKTYEIAEKAGYSNPRYFSSCFKKYTGYAPAEFRKLK